MFKLFRRRRGRDLPAHPRAAGPGREVAAVVPSASVPLGRRFLPVDGQPRLGTLLGVQVMGPGLIRPGEAAAPEGGPMHRVARLTVLRQGAIEHRDSLGHRGLLRGPAVHLISGGAGLLAEQGLAREIRRDGADVETITVVWAQAGAVTPTVRMAEQIPTTAQGRSTLSLLCGPGAAVGSAPDQVVTHVAVAAGATVDLEVPASVQAVVCVLTGTAIIGDDHRAVRAGNLALLGEAGSRLTIITRLEDDSATEVLVVAASAIDQEFIRQGDVVAADAEDLQAVMARAAEGAFGRLPRLDG